MDEAQIRGGVIAAIQARGARARGRRTAGGQPLRDQVDLDSMDWLNVIVGLHERFAVDIPEADYAQLTLARCHRHLPARQAKLGACDRRRALSLPAAPGSAVVPESRRRAVREPGSAHRFGPVRRACRVGRGAAIAHRCARPRCRRPGRGRPAPPPAGHSRQVHPRWRVRSPGVADAPELACRNPRRRGAGALASSSRSASVLRWMAVSPRLPRITRSDQPIALRDGNAPGHLAQPRCMRPEALFHVVRLERSPLRAGGGQHLREGQRRGQQRAGVLDIHHRQLALQRARQRRRDLQQHRTGAGIVQHGQYWRRAHRTTPRAVRCGTSAWERPGALTCHPARPCVADRACQRAALRAGRSAARRGAATNTRAAAGRCGR